MTPYPREHHRYIIKRIVVEGDLILETPTSLGNGEADAPTDISLLRDSITPHALLTGTSIAGALRNYLHEYELGYGVNLSPHSLSTALFGSIREEDKDSEQSPLIVDDAISTQIPEIELRDGVAIDGETGIAADQQKYDLELLAAGTEFPLRFELLIERSADERKLVKSLALALRGLERGEIGIGMKKSRGFGYCQVKQWCVRHFDLQQPSSLLAWLSLESDWENNDRPVPIIHESVADALARSYRDAPIANEEMAVALETLNQPDHRHRFEMVATFQLATPLLIRSGHHNIGKAADVEHLRSKRNGDWRPIVSGTSLAGVLRHRAERIVNTLGKQGDLVKHLFGFVEKDQKTAQASRLIVREHTINGDSADLVQARIAIDRFTGGTYYGALFNEQVLYGGDNTHVMLELELRNPQEAEIGLLLLLLKDLWTSDLPIGGGSSIGRGRLQGIQATMILHHHGVSQTYNISQSQGGLEVNDEDAAALESFVRVFATSTV